MDKYKKCAESLMRLGDEIIAERKSRKTLILRSCALGAGAAAILGIGIFANALKPPKKPTAESSGIITNTTEAVTTSAESSVQTSAKSVTTRKQSMVTTSVTTETATSKSTSSTTEKTTERMTAEVTTTLQTSNQVQSSVNTSSTETTNSNTTSVNSTIQTITNTTTYISQSTTTTNNSSSGEFPPENPKTEYDKMLEENFQNLELIDGLNYSMNCYYATDKQVGELLFELQLEPTVHTDRMPLTINAKVYEFKNSVQKYQLIVKFEGSEKNYPYVNFDYLRQIINNTEKEESS